MAVFLSANDAAEILGVTAQMVRLYERAGKLRALRTAGGIRLFFREEVDEFAAKRRNEQRKAPSPLPGSKTGQ